MSVHVRTGAEAHALARWIIDNVADDATEEGVIVSTQGAALYVGGELASALIEPDGTVEAQ